MFQLVIGMRQCSLLAWQARRDLNPQPSDLESAALPLELLAFFLVFNLFVPRTLAQLWAIFTKS